MVKPRRRLKMSISTTFAILVVAILISSIFTSGKSAVAALADQESWSKTYGGWGGDYPHYVRATSDGGYVIAGETESFGSSSGDIWIVKTDSTGGILWQKFFGGSHAEYAATIEQTTDNGYIVAGGTGSFGSVGIMTGWLVKLTANGSVEWEEALPGSNSLDHAVQTSDGGYIVAGTDSRMIGGNQHNAIIALKTDSRGQIEWQKRFEDVRFNHVKAVRETAEGGYIIGGSMEGDLTGGTRDIWLIKLDSDGTIEWEQAYGKTTLNASEDLVALDLTDDGGYVVAASRPNLVLKLDSVGKVEWEKEISGSLDLRSMRPSFDGGYILAGTVLSPEHDAFLIKLDSFGSVIWDHAYGGSGSDLEPSVDRASDGGYVLAASSTSFGVRNTDFWVMKVGSNGELGNCSKNISKDLAVGTSDQDSPARESNSAAENLSLRPKDSHATVAKTSAAVGIQCEPSILPPPPPIPPTSDPCASPTMTGTDGDDVIDGTSGDDVIDARGGNDKVNGYGGNDIICGGSGNDTLGGNSGADQVFGGIGNDNISGGTGNDQLNGGAGNDSMSGNGGSDKLIGSSGDDVLSGLDGVENNDSLDGGTGIDTCNSNPDAEVSCEL